MNRTLFSLLVAGSLLCRFCANAQEELPFPRPSAFDSRKIARDPFTPLNDLEVDKTLVVESVKKPDGKKASLASLFRVSAISINVLSIAIINNRPFAEGESFDLKGDDTPIQRVTVLKIHDGSVDLNCAGTRVNVLLQRKEPKPIEEK